MARFDKGWLKLWRKSAFSDLGQNWTLYGAWNCLLVMANIQPSDCIWNGKRRKIDRGQVLTSYSELAELGCVNRKTAKKWMEYLAERNSISIEKGKRGSAHGMIISILNFEKYQLNTNETDEFDQVVTDPLSLNGHRDGHRHGHSDGHRHGHVLENIKNIRSKESDFSNLENSSTYKFEQRFNQQNSEFSESIKKLGIKSFFIKNNIFKIQNRFSNLENFESFIEKVMDSEGYKKCDTEYLRESYLSGAIIRECGLRNGESHASV